ncbi:MAG TPA: undecaprenyl-diphosphate phosphatase, partial [Solirubrobacteraceae bacterium]|nr:undecaprenyl-diphosphate phosphatase [Solirubrobacteraceae bacterium]
RAAPSFFKPPHLGLVVISFLPPALAGYLLEEKIERHLGTPGTIAAGLLAGALGMGAADAHSGPGRRSLASATMRDGLVLGIAQALALAPGVSRNGSTLAAARLRGFSREDAQTLSWEIALPVIIGASALKSARACQRGIPAGVGKALAAGTFASFGSTLLSARCLGDTRTRRRSLLPYAVYRGLLALLVITRLRRNSTEHAARNH